MHGSSHQVLADAAFTADQDRRICIGDTLDDRPDGAHLRASVDERTVACGIGLLQDAHECLPQEEDLSSRVCPRARMLG